MCEFFSLVSKPNNTGGTQIYYFNKKEREQIQDKKIYDKNCNLIQKTDSHSSIMAFNGIYGEDEDKYNKYEYNVVTKVLIMDTQNSWDDSKLVLEKIKDFDFEDMDKMQYAIEVRKSKKREMILKRLAELDESITFNSPISKDDIKLVGKQAKITENLELMATCSYGCTKEMFDMAGEIFNINDVMRSFNGLVKWKINGKIWDRELFEFIEEKAV